VAILSLLFVPVGVGVVQKLDLIAEHGAAVIVVLAAHGIGTARAFQVDAVAGAFAGIAMSLNALVTSLLVPLAVTLLVR
jgi:putative effector of murein hydrolase